MSDDINNSCESLTLCKTLRRIETISPPKAPTRNPPRGTLPTRLSHLQFEVRTLTGLGSKQLLRTVTLRYRPSAARPLPPPALSGLIPVPLSFAHTRLSVPPAVVTTRDRQQVTDYDRQTFLISIFQAEEINPSISTFNII